MVGPFAPYKIFVIFEKLTAKIFLQIIFLVNSFVTEFENDIFSRKILL